MRVDLERHKCVGEIHIVPVVMKCPPLKGWSERLRYSELLLAFLWPSLPCWSYPRKGTKKQVLWLSAGLPFLLIVFFQASPGTSTGFAAPELLMLHVMRLLCGFSPEQIFPAKCILLSRSFLLQFSLFSHCASSSHLLSSKAHLCRWICISMKWKSLRRQKKRDLLYSKQGKLVPFFLYLG